MLGLLKKHGVTLGLVGMAACAGQDMASDTNLIPGAQTVGQNTGLTTDGNQTQANGIIVGVPSVATLGALGGKVLVTPTVQLVSFNNDSEAASVQNFLLAWAASGAWQEMTQEYGVGALTVAPLLRSNVAWAQSVSDGVVTGNANTDIESAIIASLDGATPAWGVPDGNTVYVLEMPTGIHVAPTPGASDACDANLLAWHGAVTLPIRHIEVPYVVVPTCHPTEALTQVDTKTYALSHVLVGTVTDPTGQGFAAIDAAHAVWQLVSESPEASDLCNQAMYHNSHVLLRRDDMPQALARTWSNAEAKLGHVPCVPALANEIFLAAAPTLTDAIGVALGADRSQTTATTVGLALASGGQAQVPIVLSSFPTNAGTFNVAVQEVGSQDLTLSLSANAGVHGQTLMLTVDAAQAPAAQQQVVRLTASLGDESFAQYFLVRQPDGA